MSYEIFASCIAILGHHGLCVFCDVQYPKFRVSVSSSTKQSEELQNLSSDVSKDERSKDSMTVQVLQAPMQQKHAKRVNQR